MPELTNVPRHSNRPSLPADRRRRAAERLRLADKKMNEAATLIDQAHALLTDPDLVCTDTSALMLHQQFEALSGARVAVRTLLDVLAPKSAFQRASMAARPRGTTGRTYAEDSRKEDDPTAA